LCVTTKCESPATNSKMPSAPQQLALDTILCNDTDGIGIWLINPMEWRMIDRLAHVPEGTYQTQPVDTYRTMLGNSGCCMVDQWSPENPLTMGAHGFERNTARSATTGAERVVLDGVPINDPDDVAAHLERVAFPGIMDAIRTFDEDACVRRIIDSEAHVQRILGPELLKAPYCPAFPTLAYYSYGYASYFMAYALYPELMERHFSLQADYAVLRNRAMARAIIEGGLPPYLRLDHDVADSRGTLVEVTSLDRSWFPHFARSIAPLTRAHIRMIWHCDGNLMAMVPRLIDAGIKGFQGFQYECGMDYEAICRMKAKDGDGLLIIGGVSVTRTLPHGTPDDVRRELRWLVDAGPKRGLFLGASSSIAPGVPWENLRALVEGFRHYRARGRGGLDKPRN